MATKWISPTWRMPEESNQSKFENYSLSFDGTNSSINCGIPTYLNGKSTVSVSLWVKFTNSSTASYTDLLSVGDVSYGDLYLRMNPSGSGRRIEFGIKNSFARATSAHFSDIASNTWIHLMGCIDINRNDGTDTAIFLNGTQIFATNTNAVISDPVTENLFLGKEGPWAALEGNLDQVAIWNTDQRANVSALFNSGNPINPMAITPAPTAYYPLGGSSTGSATTLTVPNDSVPSATVFDFNSASSESIVLSTSASFQVQAQTVSMWVKPELNTRDPLFLNGHTSVGNVGFEVYQDYGNIRVRINGSSQIIGAVNIGEWNHVFAAYDGADLKYSVNGAAIATTNFAATISYGFYTGLILGNSAYGYYDGQTSNVAFWTSDQSSNYVNAYNNGFPQSTYTTTPTAWYKMNVDTSTWNGSDWEIGNSTANYTTALDFDGSDYIQIPYNANLTPQTGNFTISAWVNTDNLSGWHPIWSTLNLSSSTSTVSIHTFNNNVRVTIGRPTSGWALLLDSTATLSTNTWYHIAVTFDFSGNAQIYINGNADNSGAIGTHSTTWNTGDRYIGEGEGLWDGRVSNLSIYSSELSAAQITTLYNSGTPETAISFSPVSWWKLDNTTTGIEDSAGSNNGTNNGATVTDTQVSTLNGLSDGMTTANLVNSDLTRSIPYSSYSMVFDGLSDYISFPADASLNISTANHSMSFWLKTTDSGICVVSQKAQDELAAWIQSSKIKWAAENPFSSTSNINDGTWKHICFVADGSSSYIYINGVLDATGGSQIRSSASGSAFAIGSRPGSFPYDGSISNWGLFNKALTEDQILTIYNGGVPNSISSLSPVSWWSLAGDSYYNGSDWICPDLGSASNNGTSNGMGGTELVGNGPGSTANGIATSMDIPANLKGNAPNSSKNAFSINMTAIDRVEDVPA